MPVESDWTSGLQAGMATVTEAVLAYLPNLAAGVALLLAGWLLAHLAGAATTRSAARLGRWLPRFMRRGGRWSVVSPDLLGGLVFWAVVICFVAAASQALGLTVFSAWLERVVGYLPVLAAAVLILLVGLAMGQIAREAVVRAAADLEYRSLLGYAVQAAILATAAVIGLELLGLDITLLVVLAAIGVGAVAGGLALAFGLGARTEVANLLGARHLRQRFAVGDRLRVDAVEGRVVELTERVVVLETDDGHVAVPGRRFSEQGYTVIVDTGDDD